MAFADSASAWIGNACIRTNRVHHNTFDSPHDAASCMPARPRKPPNVILRQRGSRIRYQQPTPLEGRGTRYESSGDSSSIVVMWKGQRACDTRIDLVGRIAVAYLSIEIPSHQPCHVAFKLIAICTRFKKAALGCTRQFVETVNARDERACDKYCTSMVDECGAMPEVQELHNSAKAVGTRAEDAMGHARRPPPWSYLRSRNRPLATVYFTVDEGCPYNSVKMSVVFVVRGIRLGADIQTQRSCRR
ncbi:hypothetical protein PCH_Pc22g26310 [Penicillium rubens Wisconsin 54-1255]|uniref:Uncharacterized protein n=1 Tax=Penicillium rubens (strain ATCC 28089 / DSM 1075 / NRRL 1951 / Wisconsin 54-1255) TaxID=500485 RepID=B6HTT8_PENRW|nr:hypothetical protein PCH_Pc22g26310 [Penicillium rubens Wisconsin 54-1255]